MLGLLYFGTLKTLVIVLWILALAFGLKWIKATTFAWWKVILAGLLINIGVQLLAGLALPKMVRSGLPSAAAYGLLAFFYVVGSILLVANQFQLPAKKALLASLPTFAAPAVVLLLLTLVLKPYIVDAYAIPASPMSPTLVGNHIRSECPECGATRYASPPVDYFFPEFFEDVDMICDNFHVTQGCLPTEEVYPGDHVLVSKLVTPKRWDPIVFRFPRAPEFTFVMRLVGMPGETIHIEDGAVYADGKRLELPPELEGLQYVDRLEDNPNPTPLWGSLDRPAKLKDDEFFVLGDFTTNSMDSRLWGERSNKKTSPYAVPKENIIGVATEIYWPYDRWRSFP